VEYPSQEEQVEVEQDNEFGVSALREPVYFDITEPKNNPEILKIAFGSCFGLRESNIFESINKEEADMFIWLGDVTYHDGHRGGDTEERMRERLQQTKDAKGY